MAENGSDKTKGREWHLVARDGESLPAGARRLLNHLAEVPDGPSSQPVRSRGRGDALSEQFRLTPEGMAALVDIARP